MWKIAKLCATFIHEAQLFMKDVLHSPFNRQKSQHTPKSGSVEPSLWSFSYIMKLNVSHSLTFQPTWVLVTDTELKMILAVIVNDSSWLYCLFVYVCVGWEKEDWGSGWVCDLVRHMEGERQPVRVKSHRYATFEIPIHILTCRIDSPVCAL